MSKQHPLVLYVCDSDLTKKSKNETSNQLFQDLSCSVKTVSIDMFNAQCLALIVNDCPDVIYFSVSTSAKVNIESLKKVKNYCTNTLIVSDFVFIDKKISRVFIEDILPYIDIFTSNIIDINQLISVPSDSKIAVFHSALKTQYDALHCYWLIKNNDVSDNTSTDWLLNQDAVVGFRSSYSSLNQRQKAERKNEGVDVLSSSLVCFLAHGYDVLDATTMAKSYTKSSETLDFPGWPLDVENLPSITSFISPEDNAKAQVLSTFKESNQQSMSQAFAKMDLEKMGLYPVVDTIDWLDLILKQGVKIAQLRIKKPEDPHLESKIQQAIALGKEYDAQVFINDYWQQAIALGAYGVHLGQEDLDVADLPKIQQAGLRLGISTHGYYEIARAQHIQPSYIALGHIFPTQTKDMPSQPQGLNRLNHYAHLLKGKVPTVAIGGISIERFSDVAKTAVNSVAVVSAITKSDHPEGVTRQLLSTFNLVKAEQTEKSVNT